MPRWPALPLARPDYLLQQPLSRSALMCRKQQLWSLSTPSASGLPSFTNCAAASVEELAPRPVCFFTRRRSEKSQRRVSPFCAKRKTVSESLKKICDFAVKATYWELDKAATQASGLHAPSCTDSILARRVMMRRSCWGATQLSRLHAAKPYGNCFISSEKTRRSN